MHDKRTLRIASHPEIGFAVECHLAFRQPEAFRIGERRTGIEEHARSVLENHLLAFACGCGDRFRSDRCEECAAHAAVQIRPQTCDERTRNQYGCNAEQQPTTVRTRDATVDASQQFFSRNVFEERARSGFESLRILVELSGEPSLSLGRRKPCCDFSSLLRGCRFVQHPFYNDLFRSFHLKNIDSIIKSFMVFASQPFNVFTLSR